jgi:hypothetical protein
MTKDEALDLALAALEKSVATCFDRYSHEQVMSRPEHFINQAITAIKQALAAPVQEPVAQCTVDVSGASGPSCEPLNWHKAAAPVQHATTVTSESGNPDIKMSWWHEPPLPVGTKLYTAAQPAPVQKGAIGAEYQKSPWDGKGISMPPPKAPVQEPVAWLQVGLAPFHDGDVIARTSKPKAWNPEWWRFEPLYTTPPAAEWQKIECPICGDMAVEIDIPAAQRQWVGLTDEERMDCIFATNWSKKPLMDTAKLIEAKLKEKNT